MANRVPELVGLAPALYLRGRWSPPAVVAAGLVLILGLMLLLGR